MKLRFMPVPAGTFFGRHVGLDQLRDYAALCRFLYTEITIEKKVAQSFTPKHGVARLDM